MKSAIKGRKELQAAVLKNNGCDCMKRNTLVACKNVYSNMSSSPPWCIWLFKNARTQANTHKRNIQETRKTATIARKPLQRADSWWYAQWTCLRTELVLCLSWKHRCKLYWITSQNTFIHLPKVAQLRCKQSSRKIAQIRIFFWSFGHFRP